MLTAGVLSIAPTVVAQNNVLTQHNDISRTGANTNETTLSPANVNTNSFGKLFSYVVDGYVYAQPLYMAGVTMGAGTAQAGTTHNVVFIATEHDSVYALDADGNLGANANPLWQVTLLDAAHGVPAGLTATTVPNIDVSTDDILPEIGITGTGVIDPTTNTLYIVGKTKENGAYVQRLHALDVTTGSEEFGGPVTLAASVPGNGNGSLAGVVSWDPKWENQRAGLLLLNGIVHIGFASHGDNGPWHGWILAYNAATLAQTGAWCSTPNGTSAGIWLSGSGLAADVPDPTNHPFGRMFTATGNGTFDAAAPNYNNSMDYGDSILKLDLTNGVPTMTSGTSTVGDDFTPHDQASLNNDDQDLAAGGVLILPAGVAGTNPILTQVGKTGRIYVLNRNSLGGYNPNSTQDPGEAAYVNGLFGMPAYWNGNLFVWSINDSLKAFSISNGALSSTFTSKSSESAGLYSPTPSVSANGNANGIVWSLKTDNYSTNGRAILYAHDATNVANLLYSSDLNVTRDNPGTSVKFVVPTIINGKVYVGAAYQVSVFGLLNEATPAATPVINPAAQTFTSSLQVTITDSTPGVQIFYTTDGSTPSTASTPYTGPVMVTTTETIQAIAAGTGFLQSPSSTATYTLQTQVLEPTFTPPPGEYPSAQSVTIATTTSGAAIYYTTDGSPPTTASTRYTGPVSIAAPITLKVIATAPNLSDSLVATGAYDIDANALGFGRGFPAGGMIFNGKTTLNGTRLRLTDGGASEASSAWYPTPVNIQSFATDFTFQITPGTTSTADGFAFTIQRNSTSVLGALGGGLGYGADTPSGTPGIANSVAVKFDLYSNAGEGTNSTGMYTNGASPTVPAITLGGGVNLHSGDVFQVHLSYDGSTLTMTITDTTNSTQTFTTSWPVNIPATVGGNTAYLGFTAGTGGVTAIQDILTWTYAAGSSGTPGIAATPAFSLPAGTYLGPQTVSLSDATPGATIFYTLDGTTPATSGGGSTQQYSSPITVNSTETINAIATASGYSSSAVATVTYTITTSGSSINFANGFSVGAMTLNGKAGLNGTRLRLTDGGTSEASSAWYPTPLNVQSFTSDFAFQVTGTAPTADGFTFTIQGDGTAALGPSGGGLGYGPDTPSGTPGIANSVAVKFDLYSNAGEGTNSTGMYTNGASPTVPAITLGGGVNLHSGDVFQVHLSYDGSTLTMTITDTTNSTETFTTSWPVNIPATVGGNTASLGFTAGTGGVTAIQDILTWTYAAGSSGTSGIAATPAFSLPAGTYLGPQTVSLSDATPGATIFYTLDGTTPATSGGGSTQQYSSPITVNSTETISAIAAASGYSASAVASATYTIESQAISLSVSPASASVPAGVGTQQFTGTDRGHG